MVGGCVEVTVAAGSAPLGVVSGTRMACPMRFLFL